MPYPPERALTELEEAITSRPLGLETRNFGRIGGVGLVTQFSDAVIRR